ncbi:MAG: carboxypeptidase regulatory-like domain-containing protein [Planctomycetales bacterium]
MVRARFEPRFFRRMHRGGILFSLLALLALPASAAEYGDVSGQFVFEGEIPEREVLIQKGDAGAKDAAVCAADAIPSDALLVDPETKGIRNVFVYLLRASDVHPDLRKSAKEEVVFDQKGCRFIPHALFVRTDQKVRVLSDDPVPHNTHTFPLRNQAVNFLLQPNERVGSPVSVALPELLPVQVKCDIHTWMSAYWLVLDHPYAAITDEQGKFAIEKLPAGTHKLRVWHEKVGYVDREYEVTVEAGNTTELPPVKVPAARFEEK